MNFWKRWFSRDFPKPDKTIMNLEEITQYWRSLPAPWQSECTIWVYRVRKPVEGDSQPNIWKPWAEPIPDGLPRLAMFAEGAFMPGAPFILKQLGRPGEIDDPYTIRIIREWEPSPGVSKKEEVCIANFTLTVERES
jgi:hypothetical protein